jgi:hypothetical protein
VFDPSEARYLGFLAGNTLAEGNLHQDEKVTREGYFMLLDSIKAWPEFNLFTGGYVMSRLPADSPRFREGLEWQWRTLDECAQEKFDRTNPDYSKTCRRKRGREESAPISRGPLTLEQPYSVGRCSALTRHIEV